MFFANVVTDSIEKNLNEPCFCVGAFSEGVEGAKSFEVGFLQNIFGVLSIAQSSVCHSVKALKIAIGQVFETSLF